MTDQESLDPRLDNEALLLAAMLWSHDRDAIKRLAEQLTADSFYNARYGYLFDTITTLADGNRPYDAASVRGELRSRGDTDEINLVDIDGVLVMLATLGAAPEAMLAYAAQVSSESYRRQYREMAQQLLFAADHAPEADLFRIMVDHGKAQRTRWNHHQQFKATAYQTAADPEPGDTYEGD